MLNAIKDEANITRTENGAKAFRSTENFCLDLFSSIGALRNADETDIINRFIRAYTENADLAMKILFFARDIRGGLGERRVFRTIFKWLAQKNTASADKNLEYVSEYGRFDDLFVLLGTPCENHLIKYIKTRLDADIASMAEQKEVSLLAKWLPSVNASNANTVYQGKYIAKKLEMTEMQYRKTVSSLRAYIKIIENYLRKKDYTFDYSKQPSKAMLKYRQAFLNNDAERYREYLKNVACGKANMHTGTLMPYDVIAPLCRWHDSTVDEAQRAALDTAWNALEDVCGSENAIAVIDGSGSMYSYGTPPPIQVALSLGIYFAEHNKGAFANHFITFSESPQLVEIKGRDIAEKVAFCKAFCEIANTNIQKVFELILDAAVKNKVPQSELPSAVYVISDMEFDCCTEDADITHFAYAKRRFAESGYELPKLIFWNVQSRSMQQPVRQNEQGVALVSGCSPGLFNAVLGGDLEPYTFMVETVCTERYKKISA